MKKFILLFSLTLLTHAFAAPFDVTKRDSSEYIKVSKSPNGKYVSFEYCKSLTNCIPLGHSTLKGYPSKYLVTDLKKSRKDQSLDVFDAAATVTGIAIAAGALGTPGMILIDLGLSEGAAVAVTAIAVTTLGSSAVKVAMDFSKSVNPVEQWRQNRMIDEDVLDDKKVVVPDYIGSLKDFSKSLENTLLEMKHY